MHTVSDRFFRSIVSLLSIGALTAASCLAPSSAFAQNTSRYLDLYFVPVLLSVPEDEAADDDSTSPLTQEDLIQQAADEARLAELDAEFDALSATDGAVENSSADPTPESIMADTALDLDLLQEEARAFDARQLASLERLGRLSQEANEHEDAITYLTQALQIMRINEGIYAPQQAPLFAALTESHLALGQLEEADDMQHSLYFLAQRSLPEDSAQRREAELEWADWNLNFFQRYYLFRHHPRDISQHISLTITQLDNRGVRSLSPLDRRSLFRQPFQPTMSVGTGRYLSPETQRLNDAEALITAPLAEEEVATDATLQRLLTILYLRNLEAILVIRQQRFLNDPSPMTYSDLSMISRRAYLEGIDLLEAAMEIQEKGSPEHREQRLLLADWHQLFGYPRRARPLYEELYAELSDEGASDAQLSSLFTPAPLVQLPTFIRHQFSPPEPPPSLPTVQEEEALDAHYAALGYSAYIDVQVSLHRDGALHSFRTLGYSPETPGEVRNLLRSALEAGVYRPALSSDGRVINRRDMVLRYYYNDKR